MGQQQLLLLVLSIIIVGLAVASGIDAFGENQRKARQDQSMVKAVDIAVKAQVWKMKHQALGGGDNGDLNDYSSITFSDLGFVNTEVQNGREVIRVNEYACIKLLGYTTHLHINVLNARCENGSWWMSLELNGTSYEDISFRFNESSARANAY